jgi:hypothetical protein
MKFRLLSKLVIHQYKTLVILSLRRTFSLLNDLRNNDSFFREKVLRKLRMTE